MSRLNIAHPIIKSVDNEEYFTELINSLEIKIDSINYLGRTKILRGRFGDYYTPILNDNKWNNEIRIGWEQYVVNHWGNVREFNKWCKKNKLILNNEHFRFSFKDYIDEFNLFFLQKDVYLECYVKTNPNSFQLLPLTTTKDSDFYQNCITYIRNCSGALKKRVMYITQDKILLDALKYNIANEINFIKSIIHCTNNIKTPSFTYIPYPKIRKIKHQEVSAWLLFIEQLTNDLHRELFMAWFHSLFIASDNSRQMLWIEGEGRIGKSTMIDAIVTYFMSLNPKSAKALNADIKKSNNDLFALSDLQYCRLITMADPKDCNIFNRQEIFNITGGDYTSIRSARCNPITAKLQAKIMIISNHLPIYNSKRSEEYSRIIHLKADKHNINQVKAKISDINQAQLGIDLKKQLLPFIVYTHKFYHKYLKKDGMLYE